MSRVQFVNTVGRQATLQDIADRVGMSRMSVSRILRGLQNTSPDTMEQIRAAIAETGYRVNRAASNLRQGRVLVTVGMVIDRLADPYLALVSDAVQDVAVGHDAILVVASAAHEPGGQDRLVEALLDRNVDGLLVYPSLDGSGDPPAHARDRPLVLLGRASDPGHADVVMADNVEGGYIATRHLIEHGHQRIAALAFSTGRAKGAVVPETDTLAGRLDGYRSALRDAGIAFDPRLVVDGGQSAESAADAARRVRDQSDPPTAIFATNNRMTVGVMRAFGVRLDGVALVGIDDFELADVFEPAITVVTQDPYVMGRQAAQMLFERVGGFTGESRRVIQPMTLVPRGSGELMPR